MIARIHGLLIAALRSLIWLETTAAGGLVLIVALVAAAVWLYL